MARADPVRDSAIAVWKWGPGASPAWPGPPLVTTEQLVKLDIYVFLMAKKDGAKVGWGGQGAVK